MTHADRPQLKQYFEVQGALNLGRTVRMLSLWGAATWLKVDDTGVWYAQRTARGPGTVRIARKDHQLEAHAWGPGAEDVMGLVRGLAGLDDAGVADVPVHYPAMAEIKRKMAGLRTPRHGDIYPALVGTVLAQKVTGPNGKGALRRIARRWGERAPGPRDDLWLLPTPKQLAATPYYAFHELNVERKRADIVRRVADRASALQRAAGMPPTKARAHLEKLPGIGPWTSGVICGGVLGDPDALPNDDYHLPNMVAWTLVGEERATDDRMMEILAPYAGQRGLVARMVKGAGKKAPRYGPRLPTVDIRGR